MELQLYISQESIDNGFAEDCGKCPLALELKKFFGDCIDTVSVTDRHAWAHTYDCHRYIEFKLRIDAERFVRQFDNQFPVFPTTVTLELTRIAENFIEMGRVPLHE